MDKMKMESKDRTQENYEKLAALFPNAVTETITGYDENGKAIIERAIDKDVLQQEISAVVVEGRDERYQFTWPDKKKSILAANAPIRKTLRPCREESVDFDNTENLYIEGDNLDVLKLLQETYLGKVKMIYIDPPYNTGHDFVYNDDFKESADEYMENSGQLDEEGNRLFQNTESNGRFHTDWLNMLYPRLKIARDLLSDDGVIFISIDGNELSSLTYICDEIFSISNHIATVSWKRKKEISNDSNNVAIQGEYVLIYGKTSFSRLSLEPLSKEYIEKSYNNPTKDFPLDKWRPVPLTVSKGLRGGGYTYEITTPTGIKYKRLWAYPENSYNRLLKEGKVYFGKEKSSIPQRVMYLFESKGQPISNYWDNVATNKEGKKEILTLFERNVFDTPKPVGLIQKMVISVCDENSILLDFFSGSSSSAHAVIRQNFQDVFDGKPGTRKFIMVQLPESCDEKSEAFKAGYKNICEIGKERIRRAGKNEYMSVRGTAGSSLRWNDERKAELGDKYVCPDDVDIGFRVLKLDSTNMKDVYYNPHDVQMSILDQLESNIKEDRTPEDLLFQVMLDLGVLLSSKIEESAIAGKKVFNVADNFLIACFDEDVSDETITAVAKLQPAYFVMRDSSMKNDSVATNFDQIFATYSPDTVRKVI